MPGFIDVGTNVWPGMPEQAGASKFAQVALAYGRRLKMQTDYIRACTLSSVTRAFAMTPNDLTVLHEAPPSRLHPNLPAVGGTPDQILVFILTFTETQISPLSEERWAKMVGEEFDKLVAQEKQT